MSDAEKRYTLHLEARGLTMADLPELDGTLISAGSGSKQGEAEVVLPTVTVGDAPAELEVRRTLGTGGMGTVSLAVQRSLAREVAVKQLRDAAGDERLERALLREAVVTGRLEHPNIVPVHQLARGADGAPFFVMKRIEGTPWRQVIQTPTLLAELRRGDREPLVLGRFGEVYVVDWGIAVALEPDGHLPLAREERRIAGTPAYMAPEMAAGDGASLSVQTDVYLLGAMLHEVLVRRPPHEGTTVVAVLAHAFESPPPSLPDEVPEELARLCRRALSKSPLDRPPDVAAFRSALVEFLAHREAVALAREAQVRAEALSSMVLRQRGGEAIDGTAVQAAFFEARFGFEQALRRWAGCEAASEGLERALGVMLDHELLKQNLEGARALLAQRRAATKEEVGRVEALAASLAAKQVRVERLEALEREVDLDVAVTARGRLAIGVALAMGVLTFVVGAQVRRGALQFGHREALFTIVCFEVVVWVLAATLKRRVRLNQAQLRLLRASDVSAVFFIGFWALSLVSGGAFEVALTQFCLLVSAGWGLASVLFDRRGWPVAVAFAAGAVGLLLAPQWKIELFGCATVAGKVRERELSPLPQRVVENAAAQWNPVPFRTTSSPHAPAATSEATCVPPAYPGAGETTRHCSGVDELANSQLGGT